MNMNHISEGFGAKPQCLDILSQREWSLGRSRASWSISSIQLRNVLTLEAGIELFLIFVWLNTYASYS